MREIPGEDTMVAHGQPITHTKPEAAVTDELLPCPFCGGEASIIEGDEGAFVQCTNMKMHRAIWFSGDNNAADEVRNQWNRRAQALRSNNTAGVKAQPLEWDRDTYAGWTEAKTSIGTYCAYADGTLVLDGKQISYERGRPWHDTEAAAQSDFNARILSCLSPTPIVEPVAPEAVAWLMKCESGPYKGDLEAFPTKPDTTHPLYSEPFPVYATPPSPKPSPASEGVTEEKVGQLTRPIIGIENRSAHEVFDIMADRVRAALTVEQRT